MGSTKMEADFSDAAERQITKSKDLVASRKLAEAVEGLLIVEKQARLANDVSSVKKIAVAILDFCIESGDWKAFNSNVTLLAKRRAQFKQVVTAVVDGGVAALDKSPDEATKLGLVETLRTVSEGKIYVEVQRARLTKILADAKEAKGDVAGAAELLQSVQVETYGAMDPREKTEFILEQLRLTLARKDLIRTSIISKKISPKVINSEPYADLKLRFHSLMISFHSLEGRWLDISRSYSSMYETHSSDPNSPAAKDSLFNAVVYAMLSPWSNEQVDAAARLHTSKGLEALPEVSSMLGAFLNPEIIDWPSFKKDHGPLLSSHSEFKGEKSAARFDDLHKRVIEHNIRIVARYYSRMSLSRLSSLLSLKPDDAEKYLCEQVTAGNVYARVNRPAGVVSFVKSQEPNDVLNEWNGNVTRLLELIESTTHLINRENMVYKVKS